jgi:hypothetical protein
MLLQQDPYKRDFREMSLCGVQSSREVLDLSSAWALEWTAENQGWRGELWTLSRC